MAKMFIRDPKSGKTKSALMFSSAEWKHLNELLNMQSSRHNTELMKLQKLEQHKLKSKEISKMWTKPSRKMGKSMQLNEAKSAKLDQMKDQRYLTLKNEQKKLRENHLEKANEAEFLETDDAKNLLSALRFSEVLKQRQKQLGFNNMLKQTLTENKNDEARSLKLEAQKLNEVRKEEIMKQQLTKEKLQNEIEKLQKDSEERSLREKKKQREEELKALESFKKDLDQFKADERKETERRKKLLRQNMAENINLNKLKVKQRKEEDEEERAALHIISEAKKTISMIKRKKELEFQAAKINWRSMMTSLVSPQLPTTDYIEEEKKIERVQKEKEEQYKYSLMKRKEYEQKLIEERKKQHEEFLKSEEKKKIEKSEVNKQAVQQRSVVQELDKQFTDKIKYEKMKTFEDYREAWQQQINENKSTNEYEKQIENSILMKEIKKSDEGKQQFLHYAENLLKECEEKERPVHPLKKYLNEFKCRNGLIGKKPRPSIWESNITIGKRNNNQTSRTFSRP